MVNNFDYEASNFCIENAKLLSECSRIAYQPKQEALETLTSLGFSRGEVIENNDISCFMAVCSDFVVVSFRGTDPSLVKNILTDANALQDKDILGEVHSGFRNALQQVGSELFKAVYKYVNQRTPLWITGHSLGSALATLFVASVACKGYKVSGVYTFGQPRVGGKTFKKNYQDLLGNSHFRFINNNDVVTRLPLKRLKKLVYRHVGDKVYIKSNENLVLNPSHRLIIVDRIKGRIKAFFNGELFDGVNDHALENYCRAIDKSVIGECFETP